MSITLTLKECFVPIQVEVEYSYSNDPGDKDTAPYESVEIESIHTDEDIMHILASYNYHSIVKELSEEIKEFEQNRDAYDVEIDFDQ